MKLKLVCLALLSLLLGCGEETSSDLSLALNWFPEAEHGGYYSAQVEGHFEKQSLKVNIISGGPDAPVIQKVATGRAAYGIANADDVLNARANGAKIIAVFAPIQINPRCIMVHEDSGIKSFEEIKNITLGMSARPAFSHWLKTKVKLEGVKVVPYPPSISIFLNDPKFAQQAYNISEPFVAQKLGAKPKVLMVSDLGFNPYCSVLITTEERLAKEPDEVKKFVEASKAGWLDYLKKPDLSHREIHRLNPEMPLDVLDFGANKLKSMTETKGALEFGEMTEERWLELSGQMKAAGLIDLKPEEVKKAWLNL